jgi:hypothetical protein
MSNSESKSQRAKETTDAFKSKRALLWLGGIAILVVGFLVAAIVLPATAKAPGGGGPDVRVPRMENVPPEQAPKMKLELEKQPEEK